MLAKPLKGATAAADKLYIESVFSTYLYTGNGSTQTITNGIDLSGKGGLVWLKSRNNAYDHVLCDTARGAGKALFSNLTSGQATDSDLPTYNSDGFTLNPYTIANGSGATFTSWTFRKAAKFFDIVTYTGTGSARTIAHNLGSVPGCIIIKRTNAQTSGSNWWVYHRSLSSALFTLNLNRTDAQQVEPGAFNSTAPTASVFSVGSGGTFTDVNTSGGTYVAYLFAHDAGGFGDGGNQNVISCGSYTGNGNTTGPVVNLGWEPQWLLVKRSDGGAGGWVLVDAMRGIVTDGVDPGLFANLSDPENTGDNQFKLLAIGFQPESTSGLINASGGTYIYIAIRRGPMKTPTDATKVFSTYQTSTSRLIGDKYDSNLYPPDLYIWFKQSTGGGAWWQDRLRGWKTLTSRDTEAELSTTYIKQSGKQDELEYIGNWDNATGYANWYFRRAPGFFDVVAYTGNGSTTHDVTHNLGVPPEIIITKRRDATSTTGWFTSSKYYYSANLWDRNGRLNDGTTGLSGGEVYGPDTNITSTQFRIATNLGDINASGGKYIAYLFATCPGVSKCGGYTGIGTTLSIDCGFTNGARFVLIKRADAAGDWYVWDTARGIVSGNDPYLLLNSTAAEVTNTDYIDPLTSGFEISSTAPAAINANGGSYIFLAIA